MRDAAGNLYGQETLASKIDVVLRHQDTSSWAVTMPNTQMAALLRKPGYGIHIERNNKVLISGPRTQTERNRIGDTDDFVFSGLSDECMLWDYLTVPNGPYSIDGGLFQFDASDDTTGVFETVAKHYVTVNLCDPDRQPAGPLPITVAPDLARGVDVTSTARFMLVGDLLQSLATVSGNMGFTIKAREFDVYEPVDRSGQQTFSFASGNLIGYSYTDKSPTVTHPYVAGGGEAASRVFYLGADETAASTYGRRIETFIDARDTSDPVVLAQRAAEAMARGAGQTTVTLKPIDVPNRSFDEDYGRGDIVDVEGVTALIGQVEFTYDQNGETITPTATSQNAQAAQAVLEAFDDLRRFRRQLLALQTAR